MSSAMNERAKRICSGTATRGRLERLVRLLSLGLVFLLSCSQAGDAPEPLGKDTQAVSVQPVTPTPAPTPPAPGKPAGKRNVWVVLKQQATLGRAAATKDWKGRGQQVYSALTTTAATTQAGLRAYLASRGIPHKAHWIVNTVKVTADQPTIDQIAKRPEVARIVEDTPLAIPPYQKGKTIPKVNAVEWGLDNIRVPQAWEQFGAFGDGIVVANIDSGVDFRHPALVRQYRGNQGEDTFDHNYNWFDPSAICGSPEQGPCDNSGHGTHTMGTMVGDDLAGNQVGVAPRARWIAAKGCETDFCSFEALLASGEWVLAPTDLSGQNPRPDLRPHIVNNSWGGGNGDEFYRATVQAWVAAGIFPAFASGNPGSFCGGVNSPGDYPESYAVGAYDIGNNIAFFSGRGPSFFGETKPDISGPGVDVRSSVPGGAYASFSGTSMATPHLAGAVALMWSVAPALLGDITATRAVLDESALDTADLSCGGTDGDNNVFGQGRADVFAAVDLSPRGPTGTLEGLVTASDGTPLGEARINAVSPSANRSTRSAPDGSYRLTLPVDTYAVTVTLFGYLTATLPGVAVAEGQSTPLSPALEPAPSFPVSGSVKDGGGAAIPNALVTLLGTPLPASRTDATGNYSFASVPAGTYELAVTPNGCYARASNTVIVDSSETVDFALPRHLDEYGYGCAPATYEFVEAETELPFSDDFNFQAVPLPFPVMFYGKTYDWIAVTEDGYASFDVNNFWVLDNAPIPSLNPPNAAIFAFYDDFRVEPGRSSVLTSVIGTAPNRQFVIEWRDVQSLNDLSQYARFEILISEQGKIKVQYHTAESNPIARGASATVGIENETGSVGIEYSFNSESLQSGSAVLYEVPDAGLLRGTVTDANSGDLLSGVEIRASRAGFPDKVIATDANGSYLLQITAGTYTVQASKANFGVETATVTVIEDQTVQQDFSLKTAHAEVSPSTLEFVIGANQTRKRALTLSNTGDLTLTYAVKESGGARQTAVAKARLAKAAKVNPLARDTRGLYGAGVSAKGLAPSAVGDVLASFPAPTGLAWGVGYTSNLWLSDTSNTTNYEATTTGEPTGRTWPATWAGSFPGDMALDPTRNLMCQVAVGADNGIHCWDPDSGIVTDSITGSFPWTGISQRGLAYREDDDSFYIGGWNEGIIYHVEGLSSNNPGTIISQCRPSDGDISGLAWNSAARVLWVATNSPTDTIYELNPDDCTVLAALNHPTPSFNGAGLEMDESGNLWMISQGMNTVYLIESGVPAFADVPWLSVIPAEGTVAPGASVKLNVKIDTTGLLPGIYLAGLYIQSNSAAKPSLRIPVSLVVSDYQQGVNAGGAAYLDVNGDPWAADKAHAVGSWGYFQKGTTKSTKTKITGTTDPKLFQDLRQDPYAYRFDNVPNGIYEIDLRFAELEQVKAGKRLFDVIIENTMVLPAHDIQYEVGRYAANPYKFFIEVTDQRMDVRFIPRANSLKPVINALRVTRRPDR